MANKYLHRWVFIFSTFKPAAKKLIEPTQELSDHALGMQALSGPARSSSSSCLPLHTCPSSPATCPSADEAEYRAVDDDGEDCIQPQVTRGYSCSKLPTKPLVPSFKSLLYRAHSLGHLPDRHSQSCKLTGFEAQRCRKSSRQCNQTRKRAPKGHVAIYVETGGERHVVPIAYLSHPHFQALLERAESEFGLRQAGPGLRIPCSLAELHSTLRHIRSHPHLPS